MAALSTEDIVYGYCTKLWYDSIKIKPFDEEQFRQDMSEFGDSLLVISDDEIVKVHVHSETPGEVLTTVANMVNLLK